VLLRGRGTADQERQSEPAPLHLTRHVDHLVERWSDQAREPDEITAFSERRLEDSVARNHHAEVDHLVVVAAQHDPDDVLADVVDVSLDRGEHDLAARAPVTPRPFLLLHERLEIPNGALHRARALHDLRQEHLPGAEEVADDLHPLHQRPFDHVERSRGLQARLFGVLFDVVDDPVHERMRKALLDRPLAP
jgi:hypothetical protein